MKPLFFSFFATCLLLLSGKVQAQQILAFQGGEAGDTWSYTSTGASALSISEATQSPNKVTGLTSLVSGGNTGGGNCFAGGSGNGPNTPRTFTFSPVDISTSSQFVRTLVFNWGNRYPVCNGTGWDAGENLVFTPYINGVPQAGITLATGSNNAAHSILTSQYTYSIPACVITFSFTISVTTNRADELLFLDNVTLTAPQLNGSSTPLTISGNTTVCQETTETYSVANTAGTTYNWSISPAGPAFSTANGSSTIGIDWGSIPAGTYTLTVTPTSPCSGAGTPATLTITVNPAPAPPVITGPASVCPGNPVTLTSSYPSGNSWSGGETTQSITVTSPGTYTVNITGSCGTLTSQQAVIAGSGPAIDNLAINNASCFGAGDGSISISASGTGLQYSADNINWQSASDFSALAPGTYVFHIRNSGGCISDTSVTITEPAQLSAIAFNNGPVCAGTAAQLAGNTGTIGVSYSWSGPAGFSSAVQNPDAYTAGTYTLIVSANGCTSEPATTVVSFTALPVATASNDGSYCPGQAIALTGSSDVTGSSFSWIGPNGFTSTIQNPSDATDAGTYSLTVSANGCTSTAATTTVLVNSIPDAQASYNAPYCSGTALLLSGSTTATGSISFNWNGPAGYSSQVQNPTDATATGTYTLIVAQNGCNSQPATISVVQEALTVSASNTGPYCQGEAIALQSSVSSAGIASYSWTGPNGYTSSEANPSNATAPGVYMLTVTADGCSASVSTSVNLSDSPIADFSAADVCQGETAHFIAATQQTSQQISSEWSFGDGTASSNEDPYHYFSDPGAYSVTLQVQNADGCTAATNHIITVLARPKSSFLTASDTVFDTDPTVQFVNTSVGASSYEWLFGAGTTSTDFSPEHTFSGTDDYYEVKLVSFNELGCTDTARKVLIGGSSTVYYIPNAFSPDGDEFNNTFQPVFTQGFDPMNFELRIFDRWGEVLFESHDASAGWDGSYSGQPVPSGMYVWQIVFHSPNDGKAQQLQGHLSLLR